MNKTLTNTAALNILKSQGFKVVINHYRRCPTFNIQESKWEINLIPDFEWRKYLFTGCYGLPGEKGGATILTLLRGEEKITVRADCYIKDRFCRRAGVKAALDKLQKLYNIK